MRILHKLPNFMSLAVTLFVAPPFKDAEFDILFGKGINYEGELLDLGTAHGFIQKSGTWFSYGEERMGQGRENARGFLLNNPEIKEKLKVAILEKVGLGKEEPREGKKEKE